MNTVLFSIYRPLWAEYPEDTKTFDMEDEYLIGKKYHSFSVLGKPDNFYSFIIIQFFRMAQDRLSSAHAIQLTLCNLILERLK